MFVPVLCNLFSTVSKCHRPFSLNFVFFNFDVYNILFQAVCYVLIRPLSKNTYRKINRVVAETLWLELVWIVDWWAGVKVSTSSFLAKWLLSRPEPAYT